MSNEFRIEQMLPDVDIRELRAHWTKEKPGSHDLLLIATHIHSDLDHATLEVRNELPAVDEAKEVLLVMAFEIERQQRIIEFLMSRLNGLHIDSDRALSLAKSLYGVKIDGNTDAP